MNQLVPRQVHINGVLLYQVAKSKKGIFESTNVTS